VAISLPPGTTLTLETKLFPPMVVDLTGQTPPSVSGQVAGVAAALTIRLVKPKLTVRLANTPVAVWAPGGEPGPNQWKTTRVVLLVAVGLLAFRLVRLVF
jgi:hypothetical protein